MTSKRVGALGAAVVLCIAAGCGSDKSASSAPSSSAAAAASPSTESGAAATPTAAAGSTDTVQAVALPADWPAEFALPSGVTPTQVNDQPTQKLVIADVSGDLKTVYDTLKQQLTDAGYEIVGSTFTSTDTGGYGSISAKGKTYTAGIAFGPDPTAQSNQVSISVATVEG